MRAGLIVAGVFVFLIGAALSLFLIGIPFVFLGLLMIIWGVVSSGRPRVQVVYSQTGKAGSGVPPPPPQVGGAQPGGMRYCQFCGAQMLKAASFCPACGRQQQ